MVFSSILFLFLFLPLTLLLYLIAGPRLRNGLLLLVSLLFYAWGEKGYVLLMLCSIVVNYFLGRQIEKSDYLRKRKALVFLAVALNLTPLIFFKYTAFLTAIADDLFAAIGLSSSFEISPLHLPIGISFFTFQAISYVVDVYRKVSPAQKNILDIGLYIALFPQLIAGPIVRYHDIASQIIKRKTRLTDFGYGVERFIFGLAKKVLIANQMGAVADMVFSIETTSLSPVGAWIGIICYSLQIYFDFSGYSDMAIGLGRMFGFRLLENFNYPYISRSIQEFWRRWHISLSNWFRDYLYIPLGGNRLGTGRTYMNLLLVFFLCGLWHGASLNFIIWGLFHGLFLVLERGTLGKLVKQLPWGLQHFYALMIIVNGWVFFRAETVRQAENFLKAMYGFGEGQGINPVLAISLDATFFLALSFALLFSSPIYGSVRKSIQRYFTKRSGRSNVEIGVSSAKVVLLALLLLLSASSLAVDSYNPFIYFRF